MIGTIRQEQAAGATVMAPAGRDGSPLVAGAVRGATLVAGLALGFTQTVLTLAVPTLTAAAGASAEGGALVLSAFGAGGAAGCLVVRHRNVSPLAGPSLGLPLAALGLPLLHVLLDRGGHAMAGGLATVTLIGFGIMLAMTPQMARFLAAIPRPHLGVEAALLPSAILVGSPRRRRCRTRRRRVWCRCPRRRGSRCGSGRSWPRWRSAVPSSRWPWPPPRRSST
ncbi:hypothetical protein [Streptomyces sp. NPDC093089]|uniref:hypothetical protein n=1 Tax=Streptomyces sp. NPDC093089 TaxID=3366024 RepID=UPI003823806C